MGEFGAKTQSSEFWRCKRFGGLAITLIDSRFQILEFLIRETVTIARIFNHSTTSKVIGDKAWIEQCAFTLLVGESRPLLKRMACFCMERCALTEVGAVGGAQRIDMIRLFSDHYSPWVNYQSYIVAKKKTQRQNTTTGRTELVSTKRETRSAVEYCCCHMERVSASAAILLVELEPEYAGVS